MSEYKSLQRKEKYLLQYISALSLYCYYSEEEMWMLNEMLNVSKGSKWCCSQGLLVRLMR